MIFPSFLWCTFCFAIFGLSWGQENPFLIPVCENKQPEDVYLDFSNSDFNKLSKSFIIESSIKCLNYENGKIQNIDRDAFDNVPELYYLNLARNPIDFEDFIKTNIPNLKTLILDEVFNYDNYGRRHQNNYYDDVSRENVDGNDLSENTFWLPELEKLSLRNYGPRHSQRSKSRLRKLGVPKLTHLDLSANYLTTIPNLEKMPSLTHLNLDENRMAYISGSLLQNLNYLSMDRNKIGKVCRTFCSLNSISPRGMHNLTYLSLVANEIRVIDSDAFADLENLLILNLEENRINEIQQHTFDNVTRLQNLTLDGNILTRVPDVSGLQELKFLSLNDNNIVAIDEMTFRDMPKLAEVYMRNNGMTTITNMAFGILPSLKMIDFECNKINFLPENWITPNNSLEYLRLDRNKFTDVRNMTLEQSHNLKFLGLEGNPIKEMSPRALMKFAVDLVIDLNLGSPDHLQCK